MAAINILKFKQLSIKIRLNGSIMFVIVHMATVAILWIVYLLVLDQMKFAITIQIVEFFPFLTIDEMKSSMIAEKVEA